MEAAPERSERVSKFVGEGGQELVLPPVGVLQGFLVPQLPVGHVLGHPEDELGLARGAELGHQTGVAYRRTLRPGPRSRTR